MVNKFCVVTTALLCAFSSPIFAAETALPEDSSHPQSVQALPEGNNEAATVFDGVTGDWGGLRRTLADKGFELNGIEILDIMGNPGGGVTQGATVQGRFDMSLDLDFEKMIDAKGLTGHVTGYQLHGRGMSISNLNNNIHTSTGIEAPPVTQLYTAWLQQNFFKDDLSVRVGQLAADDEFLITEYGALFINAAYGWPTNLGFDLPGGGPAYPYATPGVRLRIGQTDPWSVMLGVFDGDPSARGTNTNGTDFNLSQGAYSIAELAYAPRGDKGSTFLPGTYKVGGWYHTENFADPRYDTDGLSLADPNSNGIARQHHGNYGFYGIIDQALFREKQDQDQGLNAFTRFIWGAPDRNKVPIQFDFGLTYKGLFPTRDDDTIGVAFSTLRASDRASGADRDTNRFNNTNAPVRDYENDIELTYQAPLTSYFTVQPSFQYIMHPGANIADPKDADGVRPIKDTYIFGLRGIVKF